MKRLPIGTVINERYTIVDVFGVGGFATVYKAIQENIERAVAIKIFDPHESLGDAVNEYEANLERFKREAKAVARLNHPNVVMVFDVGEFPPNRPFIVMQPFDGRDLSIIIRDRGAFSPEHFIPLFVDCLDALALAHEQGIIHRDLKPENLVLCTERRRDILKVIDFGIVHLDSENVALTRAGRRVGTPRYFSPEYVKDRTISPALDVYQLGITLVECLTARRVVRVSNPMDAVMVHLSGGLELPRELLLGPLGDILRRSMALDYRQRFSDAGEMRDALMKVDPTKIKVGDVDNLLSLKAIKRERLERRALPTIPPASSAQKEVSTVDYLQPTEAKAPPCQILRKPETV